MIARVQFATTARTAVVSTVRTRAMPVDDDDDDDGARRIVMRAHRWRTDDAICTRDATPPRARAVDRGTVRARA